MDIKKTRNDHAGHDEFVISDESNWALFDAIASALESHLQGSWIAQLDGLDQRYWDLQVGNGVITLHLEHYLGIMLFMAHEGPDQVASQALLECALDYLASFQPV